MFGKHGQADEGRGSGRKRTQCLRVCEVHLASGLSQCGRSLCLNRTDTRSSRPQKTFGSAEGEKRKLLLQADRAGGAAPPRLRLPSVTRERDFRSTHAILVAQMDEPVPIAHPPQHR